MNYGFIGSRDYPSLHVVRDHATRLKRDDVVITGAWWEMDVMKPTRGVDHAAAMAARAAGHVVALVGGSPKEGRAAGLQRNPTIIALSGLVVAYWDLKSPGTARGIVLAENNRKLRRVFGPDGVPVDTVKAYELAMDMRERHGVDRTP